MEKVANTWSFALQEIRVQVIIVRFFYFIFYCWVEK